MNIFTFFASLSFEYRSSKMKSNKMIYTVQFLKAWTKGQCDKKNLNTQQVVAHSVIRLLKISLSNKFELDGNVQMRNV